MFKALKYRKKGQHNSVRFRFGSDWFFNLLNSAVSILLKVVNGLEPSSGPKLDLILALDSLSPALFFFLFYGPSCHFSNTEYNLLKGGHFVFQYTVG